MTSIPSARGDYIDLGEPLAVVNVILSGQMFKLFPRLTRPHVW